MKKIFLIIICFFICSCTNIKSTFNEVIIDDIFSTSNKITLTMVGDALIHSPIYNDANENGKYNFNKMFTFLESSIKNSDLLYYNAETILGGTKIGLSGYPRFNTPEEFGETMINLGFNLVSRANNHTLDKGEAGILNACSFWNKYPYVMTNGSSCSYLESKEYKIMEKKGITYTLLSYTTLTNGLKSPNEYYVNIYSDEKAKKEIEYLRDKVDILLVAMHWGDEYKAEPNDEQMRIARYLSSLDVDIIIGTHPHVIEPIEWIDDTLVIYSLGNFISNQSSVNSFNRRIGLMVNVDIIKTETKNNYNIKLDNLNTELIFTYKENQRNFKIYPFSKLSDTIFPNYKAYKEKYNEIIKRYDKTIITN